MSADLATAWQAMLDSAAKGRPWIKAQQRTVDYRELVDRIRRFAGIAHDRGLTVGDRVIIATADDEEAALLFVATLFNGLTAVVIDSDASADRARALIEQAEPRLILVASALVERWRLVDDPRHVPIVAAVRAKGLLGQLRRTATTEGLAGLLEVTTPAEPPPYIPPETLAYILFTSGTTSQPKGVCISHRALFAHLGTLVRVYGLDRSSIILNTLMLSHADGMIQGPLLSAVNAALLLRPVRFEVSTIPALLDTVFRARVTHMVAVPTMLSLIVNLVDEGEDAFSGGDFRIMISCGAALEAWLWEAAARKLGVSIVNVYGLTETVAGGIFAGALVDADRPGTIGRPIDCDVRIVDAEGGDLENGQSGELWMRGPLVMSGYFNAPDLTNDVLDADHWLHTGDLAVIGEDGLISITGRKKNIVIRGGYNIQPEEVTEVLNQHPMVEDAVSFGLPDRDWGERLVAVVGGTGVAEAELIEFAAQRLEPRKVPSRILVVAQVPKGRSGKASLPDARALFDQQELLASVERSAGEGDAEARLLSIAQRCFRMELSALSLSLSPEDALGWDSMAHMEFVMALEQEFGVELSPRDVMSIDRLDKALALVSRG